MSRRLLAGHAATKTSRPSGSMAPQVFDSETYPSDEPRHEGVTKRSRRYNRTGTVVLQAVGDSSDADRATAVCRPVHRRRAAWRSWSNSARASLTAAAGPRSASLAPPAAFSDQRSHDHARRSCAAAARIFAPVGSDRRTSRFSGRRFYNSPIPACFRRELSEEEPPKPCQLKPTT